MRLDDIIRLFKALSLFDNVEPEALRILAFSASQRQLRAGDVLFRKGETSDGGFLIIAGHVIYDLSDDGTPSQTAFGPGVLLGQAALFAPAARPATAIARDNATILSLSRDLVRKVLEAHPASAESLSRNLAAQASALARRLETIAV